MSRVFGFWKLNFYLLFIFVFLISLLFPLKTHAAALTTLSDTMSRMEKSPAASDHTIKFTTPTGAGDVGDTIEITMPSGFTIGSVNYTDMDLSHGASTGYETEETLAATADGTNWGASFTGQILSLEHPTNAANGDIAATDKVIVEIGTNAAGGDQQITNHATAATYTISIGGGFGDTGKIAIVILDDDQVTVNATVDPSLTFTISAISTDFGSLPTGSVDTSSPNITLEIGTNSANGYIVTVKDSGNSTSPGLFNSNASKLIGSANDSFENIVTLVNGTEGYGLQASSASATIDTRFDGKCQIL